MTYVEPANAYTRLSPTVAASGVTLIRKSAQKASGDTAHCLSLRLHPTVIFGKPSRWQGFALMGIQDSNTSRAELLSDFVDVRDLITWSPFCIFYVDQAFANLNRDLSKADYQACGTSGFWRAEQSASSH